MGEDAKRSERECRVQTLIQMYCTLFRRKTYDSQLRCCKHRDEATEGPHIFSLASAQAVDIILGFAIHPLLFGACGHMRLCSRVCGRSDCKLGGGGGRGGPTEFVKTNKNALNHASPPLE